MSRALKVVDGQLNCRKCLQRHPATAEFFSTYKARDGEKRIMSTCKQCAKRAAEAWREANRETVRTYERSRRSGLRQALANVERLERAATEHERTLEQLRHRAAELETRIAMREREASQYVAERDGLARELALAGVLLQRELERAAALQTHADRLAEELLGEQL